MKVNLKDLVYTIPNAISDDMCNHLINHHIKMCNRGLGIPIDRKDDKKGIDIKISTDVLYEHHGDPDVIKELNSIIKKHFIKYGNMFDSENFSLTEIFNIWPRTNYNILQIQKYDTGVGGYPAWHIDKNYEYPFHNREYVYMFYLNDVEEGGETEFLYLNNKIKPVKGTLVYFPTHFPFVHRGNIPISDDKYIMTGWICEKKPNEKTI
jgi:hypothetical protein